jgi:hypothetical protein
MYSSTSGCHRSIYVFQRIPLSICTCNIMRPVVFILHVYSGASYCLHSVYILQCTQFPLFCTCNTMGPIVFILYMYSGTSYCRHSVYILQCHRLPSFSICVVARSCAANSPISHIYIYTILIFTFCIADICIPSNVLSRNTREILSNLHLCTARLSALLPQFPKLQDTFQNCLRCNITSSIY